MTHSSKLIEPTEGEPRWAVAAISEIYALHRFLNSSLFGLSFTAHLTQFLERAPEMLEALPRVTNEDDSYKTLESWAGDELRADCPYLYGVAIVRLVIILETMVTDLCAELISARPDVLERDALQRLKGPLLSFARASEAERTEYLMEMLSQDTRARLKPGVGRFEPLLEAIGLGGGVAESARRTLLELIEIRNLTIHRNGRGDRRFIERCPWLNIALGAHVVMNYHMFDRYVLAVRYYALELLRRWICMFDGDAAGAALARMCDELAGELGTDTPDTSSA